MIADAVTSLEELVQCLCEFCKFVLRHNLHQLLFDGVGRAAHNPNTNPDVIVQVLLRQLLAILGEGGREHHRLALFLRLHAMLFNNFPDLRLETHVQDPVCLIEHQDVHTRHCNDAPVDEVLESAGCCHNHVRPFRYLDELVPRFCATIDDRGVVVGPVAELHGLLVDLDAQLAGRRDDERVGRARPFVGDRQLADRSFMKLHHSAEHGDEERSGLAAAGLCATHDVPANESNRDGVLLHGRWQLVHASPHILHEGVCHALAEHLVKLLKRFAHRDAGGFFAADVDWHVLIPAEVQACAGS
mmetsp:Transcript_32722/g.90281  ORF Transcript_32722/g.90281 Transcript_32722/m.90281 type:complete len:301 (+) Transcript_32722:869-1771(+)